MKTYSHCIDRIRLRTALPQREVAELIGVHESAISRRRAEGHKTTRESLIAVNMLAAICEASPDEFDRLEEIFGKGADKPWTKLIKTLRDSASIETRRKEQKNRGRKAKSPARATGKSSEGSDPTPSQTGRKSGADPAVRRSRSKSSTRTG
jgi:transcriptional regulator with XRE-family HTH domain